MDESGVPSLREARAFLETAAERLRVSEQRLASLESRYVAMSAASSNAEEMAGAAMKAAEAAVADEIEKLSGVQRLEVEVEKARTDLEKMLSALLKATNGFEGMNPVTLLAEERSQPAESTSSEGAAGSTKRKQRKVDPAAIEQAAAAAGIALAEDPKKPSRMQALMKYKYALIAAVLVIGVMATGPQSALAQTLIAPLKLLPMAQAKFGAWFGSLGLPHIENGMVDMLWLLVRRMRRSQRASRVVCVLSIVEPEPASIMRSSNRTTLYG